MIEVLLATRSLCISSACIKTAEALASYGHCLRCSEHCLWLSRIPTTFLAIPSSPAARRGTRQSPACDCSTCSAEPAAGGPVMGACCSLFSRRPAKAASLVPGKRGAVTPLGEPRLVPCSRACAALCLEPEAGLVVHGFFCCACMWSRAPHLQSVAPCAPLHTYSQVSF